MSSIALFHSVLGVRPGVADAARHLTAAGHDVTVVDQYDGRVFDDDETASGFAEAIGYPALMGAAVQAVADLPDGFIAAGFSNGGGMAEYVATRRKLSGSPVDMFDYPGEGHLFTDESLADEFDTDNTALLWERVIDACGRLSDASLDGRRAT